ncbi:MAG: hypothetical protein M1503_00440 [Thaumarchaeota archaeon]|nr:hypothetical protein [Nitrososphaerota archaeon]MCL5316720.1 hypothetical protein [Nitrososphaerota archaeon]
MVKINLGKLKNKESEIGAFLQEKLGATPSVGGGSITIGDEDHPVKVADVKTYLKRYIHREGLKNEVRVIVEKGEVIITQSKFGGEE